MSEDHSKAKERGYWVATVLFCLVMTSSGVQDLMRVESFVETFEGLGYPLYLLTILGVLKLFGGVAVLAPGFARIKEWAYAGFTFQLLGAIVSHAAMNDAAQVMIVPGVFWLLGTTSYFFDPTRGAWRGEYWGEGKWSRFWSGCALQNWRCGY